MLTPHLHPGICPVCPVKRAQVKRADRSDTERSVQQWTQKSDYPLFQLHIKQERVTSAEHSDQFINAWSLFASTPLTVKTCSWRNPSCFNPGPGCKHYSLSWHKIRAKYRHKHWAWSWYAANTTNIRDATHPAVIQTPISNWKVKWKVLIFCWTPQTAMCTSVPAREPFPLPLP